jgi:RND family efflux transporter MFP subunit
MKKLVDMIKRFAGWFQLMFVVGVVGAAVLLSVALKPESSNRFASGAQAPLVVSVVDPDPIAYEPVVSLNGVVESRTITQVIPQVGGRVMDVSPAFRAGAEFEQGDVLFRIEPADFELAVERTLAEIETARSELAQLEAEAIAEKRVWSQQYSDREIPDLIARVPQISAAKARIKSGEAARAAAELSLERTIVRAPFNGRVLDTQLDIGQVVAAGQTVGSVFSDDSLEIAVPVSNRELALIGNPIGRPASIALESSATAGADAVVTRQAAALDEQTRLSTLFLTVERGDPLILGDFVSVEIRGRMAPDVFRVPAGSLTSRDQVWVVEDGALKARQVEVVGNEGDTVFIRSFDIGDGIVSVPPSNVRDGLPVETRLERMLARSDGAARGSD